MKLFLRFLVLAPLGFVGVTQAQDDTPVCGVTCLSHVNDTGCAASQWSCLCKNTSYLESLAACVQKACSPADYDTTISIIAQLCDIFSASPTISPFATATTVTNNPILSTLDITTSLPPVSNSSSVSSGASSTSSIDNIAGTSVSTITTSGASSSSGAAATASATTTNIAQRVDLKKSAVQGVAIALLGLAFYL